MTTKPVFIITLAALLSAAVPDASAQEVDCSIAKSAINVASEIRGLPILRDVPCKLRDRKAIETYLRDTIRKKSPANKLMYEGLAYKMAGLLPADFKYLEGVIALYTSQLGGYYDPDRELYVMAGWMPAALQVPIAVHELTHALQDQHFNLGSFMKEGETNNDVALARSALTEGDATAVMLDHTRQLSGQSTIAQEPSVINFMTQNLIGAMLTASVSNAPPALQAIMVFPYMSGLNFVNSLLKEKGYEGLTECYKKPPRSTEEILHPEKFAKGDFAEVPVSPLPAEPDLQPVYRDTLGEFTIATMLSAWLPPARSSNAAAGWGGDTLALYHKGKHYFLVWRSLWDSENDAREFYAALADASLKRFEQGSVEPSAARFKDKLWGDGELTLSGKEVLFVLGPAALEKED